VLPEAQFLLDWIAWHIWDSILRMSGELMK